MKDKLLEAIEIAHKRIIEVIVAACEYLSNPATDLQVMNPCSELVRSLWHSQERAAHDAVKLWRTIPHRHERTIGAFHLDGYPMGTMPCKFCGLLCDSEGSLFLETGRESGQDMCGKRP